MRENFKVFTRKIFDTFRWSAHATVGDVMVAANSIEMLETPEDAVKAAETWLDQTFGPAK